MIVGTSKKSFMFTIAWQKYLLTEFHAIECSLPREIQTVQLSMSCVMSREHASMLAVLESKVWMAHLVKQII